MKKRILPIILLAAVMTTATWQREFSRPCVYAYHDNFSSANATISIFGREDPEE